MLCILVCVLCGPVPSLHPSDFNMKIIIYYFNVYTVVPVENSTSHLHSYFISASILLLRHLEQFWGASKEFWTNPWATIYQLSGENDFLMYTLGESSFSFSPPPPPPLLFPSCPPLLPSIPPPPPPPSNKYIFFKKKNVF